MVKKAFRKIRSSIRQRAWSRSNIVSEDRENLGFRRGHLGAWIKYEAYLDYSSEFGWKPGLYRDEDGKLRLTAIHVCNSLAPDGDEVGCLASTP